jgi:CRP-like cAMP-binding protein
LSERLARLHPLSLTEKRIVDDLLRHRRQVRAGTTLIRRGDESASTIVMCSGMAIRLRHTIDGKRQIFGYCLPGDFTDDRNFMDQAIEYDVLGLSDADVADVSFSDVAEAVRSYPNIGRSLQVAAGIETRRLREWLLNIGYRSAPRRIAYFLCEIESRLSEARHHPLCRTAHAPLTQTDLADMLGLTKMHINRSLKQLRQEALIGNDRRHLDIIDAARLRKYAGFKEQPVVDRNFERYG